MRCVCQVALCGEERLRFLLKYGAIFSWCDPVYPFEDPSEMHHALKSYEISDIYDIQVRISQKIIRLIDPELISV